jgi:hypothetical protein
MELGVGIQPVRKFEENVGNKELVFAEYLQLISLSIDWDFNTGLNGEDDNNDDDDDIATATRICNLFKISSNKF